MKWTITLFSQWELPLNSLPVCGIGHLFISQLDPKLVGLAHASEKENTSVVLVCIDVFSIVVMAMHSLFLTPMGLVMEAFRLRSKLTKS